jgi:hypothetical protein
MRKGYENGFLSLEGKYVGINLGSDFVAEHEWGIKDITKEFGIDGIGHGLEKRIIKSVSKNLIWKKIDNFEGMILTWYSDGSFENLKREFSKGLFTAWDGSSFAVMSDNPIFINSIREVFEAIQNKDAVIWLGGGGVFQNAGLVIGIASRLPKKITDEWEKVDRDQEVLQKEFEESGIEKVLEEAGCKYFALTPSRDTNGKMIIWLNPYEQRKFNSGWFTLYDLRGWSMGKGKVIKK